MFDFWAAGSFIAFIVVFTGVLLAFSYHLVVNNNVDGFGVWPMSAIVGLIAGVGAAIVWPLVAPVFLWWFVRETRKAIAPTKAALLELARELLGDKTDA